MYCNSSYIHILIIQTILDQKTSNYYIVYPVALAPNEQVYIFRKAIGLIQIITVYSEEEDPSAFN